MQATLVEQAARGDHEAFEALVRASSNRLFSIAYRILRDHHAAEDALQSALATIWDELPRLRDPERFDAWTYRLITRASIAQAQRDRRGGTIVRLLPDDADADPRSTVGTAGAEIDAVADRDQIERGFARLKPEHRAILVLQHYAGLSLAEIADVLGIPAGTAASRIHYATRTLRAALDADARISEPKERTA
jgi:RNA polymerase sigma-70 factor (ECF subfamily)